jgi:hypothetical protein
MAAPILWVFRKLLKDSFLYFDCGLDCNSNKGDDVGMADVESDIAAYEAMKGELEAKHMGFWVLFYEGKLIALFDSFEGAAEDAVRRFGRGPYLIRQIGAPPVSLPASLMYRPTRA